MSAGMSIMSQIFLILLPYAPFARIRTCMKNVI
jgi:hypothetical protein